MAARFVIQLLCMSCNVCMIVHVCSLQGVNCNVPDGVVYTDLHKTAEKGNELVMKCQFYGLPFAVYWKKGDDPTKSPNLITRVDGESASGSCVHDESCYMSNDYSLIIRNITVSDQGTYICRVSNYNGILIHNFTEVNVFARPMEPFPLIDECREILPNDAEQTCSLSTSDNITITCSASSYFPDIDLFFLHESKKMDATNIKEVANMDGTKNKSISTLAEPSESPYVCVASDIPGSQDQRTVTATVTFLGSTVAMTTSSNQTASSPGGGKTEVVVAVIVVILILVAFCVVIIICWRRRRQRRNQEIFSFRTGKDDQESLLLDPWINVKVSFYELWCLVQNMNETNLKMLKAALIDLQVGIPVVEEELTEDKAYDLICDWKDNNTEPNEKMRLKNTFAGHGLENSCEDMYKRRYCTNIAVSEELLEHILWNIGDETKIRDFLRVLITEIHETRPNVSGNKGDVIEESMGVLREWRETAQSEHQVIQLSLTLERAKFKPLDRTFFKVPEHLLKAISPQEVEVFVYRLTGRHCKRLAKAEVFTDEKKFATIIDENNDDLFDTQSMIIDWVDGQECCNYEKRCTLDDAVIKIGRHDVTDSFGTTFHRVKTGGIVQRPHPDAKNFNSTSIFNDDLQALLKHLPTGAVSMFLDRLGISVDQDRDDMEEKLRGWRDEHLRGSKACSLKELVLIHKDVLNKTNNSNVLDLTDDELEDVFASISSRKQMDQLTTGLGVVIKEESLTLQHLKEWRDSQDMEKRRETLRKTLHDMKLSECIVNRRPPQHVYKAETVRLAFSILCTDVGPLAALLNMDTSKGKIVREHQKGTVGLLLQLLEGSRDGRRTHRRRDFCVAIRDLGYLDVARLAYFDYDESLSVLNNITLNLSQQEMESLVEHFHSDKAVLSLGRSAGTYDNMTLMKRWRDQFRPEPFHYVSKLVHGLRAIGRTGRADDVLEGMYKAMEMSTAVGVGLCNSLDNDQLQRLYLHLGIHATNGQEDRTTKITTVVEWMKNCTKHFDKIPVVKEIVTNKFIFRKHENNELFKAGFVELAEEIMLLQYPRFPRIV